MKKTKSNKKCNFKGCKAIRPKKDRFCHRHKDKVTISRFLSGLYRNMKARVEGRWNHNRGNWAGKPILPKEIFKAWGRNHPVFLSLYKQWIISDFDNKLTPSINRIHSHKGYTLDNMEWLTNSQNSGLSGTVRKMKQRKEIYNLVGVNSNV